jgi:hypothetical protein
MKTYQNETSREDGKNVGYERKKKGGEQQKHEATSNKWRKCTQIQQHKITERKVQGQKVRGQGSNLIFFVVFPVDVGTMNSSQTKGIKLDKTHRSTRNRIPLDRAGVPDLSVRWIISIGGGGDSHDPTTNEQVVAP